MLAAYTNWQLGLRNALIQSSRPTAAMRWPHVPWAVEGAFAALIALNAADLLTTVVGLTGSPHIHEVSPAGAPLIAAGGLAALVLVKLAAMCALVGGAALYYFYGRPENSRACTWACGAVLLVACAFYVPVVANNVAVLRTWL